MMGEKSTGFGTFALFFCTYALLAYFCFSQNKTVEKLIHLVKLRENCKSFVIVGITVNL
jgi:hypothetical protein